MNAHLLEGNDKEVESYFNIANSNMGNIVSLDNPVSPLSPIFNNGNQRKFIYAKRTKSRINLESKFKDEPKNNVNSTIQKTKTNLDNQIKKKDNNLVTNTKVSNSVDKLKKAKEIEKQRKKYYDILSNNDVEKNSKPSNTTKVCKTAEIKKETIKTSNTNTKKDLGNNVNPLNNETKLKEIKNVKELTNSKETVININIKSYKPSREKNVEGAPNKSNENASHISIDRNKKNVQVILSANESKNKSHEHKIKTSTKNNHDTINEEPIKLLHDFSFVRDITDSQLIVTAEKLIPNSQMVKHDMENYHIKNCINSTNLNPNKHNDKIVKNTDCNNDFMLTTQETNLYFSNFTPNIIKDNNFTKTSNENAVDNIFIPERTLNTSPSETMFGNLESETSESNGLQKMSDANLIRNKNKEFLGCNNKDIIEATNSCKIVDNLKTELEESLIRQRQKYEFAKRRNVKNETKDLITMNKNLEKFEEIKNKMTQEQKTMTLCKKSKSMDVISECSSSGVSKGEDKIIIQNHTQPTYVSPTKNIQIEIKNNNVINIHINSNFDNFENNQRAMLDTMKDIKNLSKSENLGPKQIENRIPEDKFALHQQQLGRTIKEAFDSIKFEPNLETKPLNELLFTPPRKKHINRKKHCEEVDTTLAPANKRNKYESQLTEMKHNVKMESPPRKMLSQKCKPIINVFNVTTPAPIMPDFFKTNNNKKSSKVTSGFTTTTGKKITISEALLQDSEVKFQDEFYQHNPLKIKTQPIKTRKLKKHVRNNPLKQTHQIINNNSLPTLSSDFNTVSGSKCNIQKSALNIATNLYNTNILSNKIEQSKEFENSYNVENNFNSINKENSTFLSDSSPFVDIENSTKSTLDLKDILSYHTPIKSELSSFYNDLYNKDIQNISNPNSSNLPSFQTSSVSETNVKKEYEIIEDVIKTVTNALEKIEKRQLSNENVKNKRKSLGMGKCRRLSPLKKINQNNSLDLMNSKNNLHLNTMSTPKSNQMNHKTSTPLNSRNQMVPFMGDFITPIKEENKTIDESKSILENPPIINSVDSKIVINLFQEQKKSTPDDYVNKIEQLKQQMAIFEERKEALEVQDNLIEHGNEAHRKQRPGYLLGLKSNRKKINLSDMEELFSKNSIFVSNVATISPKNALHVEFSLNNTEAVIRTIDGAIVIPNVNNMVGLKEIDKAFLAMPGIQPNLIPKKWLANHYKWIIWKLASYDRKFQTIESLLSIENVIQQLKLRYDKEIYGALRPTIRKIFEGDDIPEKRMVLCVSDIFKISENIYELELTDGWYPIRTTIDQLLCNHVSKMNIIIGTKLTIQCATLSYFDPAYPLDAPENTRLVIHYNNTRIAKWHAKLGYQKHCYFRPIPLTTIHRDGGLVSCLKLYIARIYPLKYLETIDNKKVWRNENAEKKAANKHQIDLEKEVDSFAFDLQQLQIEKNKSISINTPIDKRDIINVNCPETLHALIEQSKDPETLMSMLKQDQMESVINYKQQLHQTLQNEIIDKMLKFKNDKNRNVVSVLKLFVYDLDSNYKKGTSLYVWNPNEFHLDNLVEETSVMAYNLMPRQNCELCSIQKTRFNIIISSKPELKVRRSLLPIALLMDEKYVPPFNEFDTIGIFIKFYKETNYQEMWLCDFVGRLLCIKIYYNSSECSIDDNLNIGNVIIITNLIYSKPNALFALAVGNHCTTASLKCKIAYHQEAIETFKNQLPKNLTLLIDGGNTKIEMVRNQINYQNENEENHSIIDIKCNDFLKDSFEDTAQIPSQITDVDIAMSLIPLE